ncbi:MAG TPA: hypothetical protein VKD46_01410 [bacterium]|nr:hypothetical protein [bacterium]
MGHGNVARSARIEAVRRRIEHWRRVRERRSPMPALLWAAAVALAAEHGVYPIARALRLNYETLKARVGRRADGVRQEVIASARFVPVDGAPVLGAAPPAGRVVELSSADGATLVIRLAGRDALDVRALAAAFWRRT